MKKTTKSITIQVIESFQISNFGIIVIIKNDNKIAGLKKGTILKAIHSNKSWSVKNRIIEFPSIETVFENETITNSFLKFSNVENKIISENKAKKRNQKNIFQYQIEPVFHTDKPEKNEILEII